MAAGNIFYEHELDTAYNFPTDMLPTINDCLLYCVSRTNQRTRLSTHPLAVREMAVLVEDIWTKADCCPFSAKHIADLFEKNVMEHYTYLLREKHFKDEKIHEKRSHKKDPSKRKVTPEPSRKSSRYSVQSTQQKVSSQTKTIIVPDAVTSSQKSTTENVNTTEKQTIFSARTRSLVPNLRAKWFTLGITLFDVKSEAKVNKSYFDVDFYDDQKSVRNQRMLLTKVTKEYALQEETRKKTELAKKKRRESQQLIFETVSTDEVDLEVEAVEECNTVDHMECEEANLTSPICKQVSNVRTRNLFRLKSPVRDIESSHVSTQTESNVSFKRPVRIEGKRSGKSHTIDPSYLKAMALIMAENLSASEAIKVVHIVDTIIYDQIRHLPLRLEKNYVKAVQRLRKLRGVSDDNHEHNFDTEIEEQMKELETIVEEASNNDGVESNDVDSLKNTVNEFINIRKDDIENLLPDTKCVRENHNLISVYVEGKIADKILKDKSFIMPDGTSRQGVGDMAGAVVKVGNKIRAIKGLKIGKTDRDNWAKAIYHMLDRLATASSHQISSIWENIIAMLSDLCTVNLKLAIEIKKLIGTEWLPGQIFCNLHYTLAIPVGIKKILTVYQSLIGSDKLFPENVGFDMNIEDKLIVVQILECWMRLTSIRWQSKPWNRYSKFTEFAERRGVKNVGHMLHANRFGEFEERCAGGVYLAQTWMAWLRTFTDIRNQLSCYLRSVLTIMDVCVFLWAGAALIGIHVTAPFMSMLLDHKVTTNKLLQVLPRLHSDLHSYPMSLAQLDSCAVPALSEFFLDPYSPNSAPYGVEVSFSLRNYIESCDKDLMDKYLRQICTELAVILKRQRGDQYGFGDDPDSPAHVKKNMSEAMLDDPDATHSKPIENYFGNLDRELKKSGAQGFDKCTSDLVIKYSKDLIEKESKWQTKANKAAAKEIDIKQRGFNEKQKEMISNGVDEVDVDNIFAENQIIKCLSQCRISHNGPLTTVEDLHNLADNMALNDDNELHKCLNLEIRFRKFTMTEVKSTCPLFRQKGLSVQQKVKNLEALIDSQLNFKALASMCDLESAVQANIGENIAVLCASLEKEHHVKKIDKNEETLDQMEVNASEEALVVGEFVLGLFEDGAYPSEVVSLNDDTVKLNCLHPVVIGGKENFRFWKWPSSLDTQMISKESVLPIRPSLDVSKQHSNRRNVILELNNFDMVEKFL